MAGDALTGERGEDKLKAEDDQGEVQTIRSIEIWSLQVLPLLLASTKTVVPLSAEFSLPKDDLLGITIRGLSGSRR